MTTTPSPLLGRVTALLDEAARTYAGTTAAAEIDTVRARLDEPLRVAVAGKAKAGKSTLLNALVGEVLAPTDAGECTRIVTWYRNGHTYRTLLAERGGPLRTVPFDRVDGAVVPDLGGLGADRIDRLVVEWPSATLRVLTLIDTPGIGSLSADVSARTVAFLAPEDEVPSEADAVVYLMRHLHATDVRFLEAFHDADAAQATPVNAVGVLSRADEVGAGRLDALASAARIADRYRTDPTVRRLCQTVVPVAGLLAQAAATLTTPEYEALARLASLPADEAAGLLISVDRFAGGPSPLGLAEEERRRLLDRLGMFGVRLADARLRAHPAPTAPWLAGELRRASGIDGLREVLATRFASQAELLKSRSALLAVERLVHHHPVPGSDELAGRAEAVRASSHELTELRLRQAIRSGAVELRAADAADLERLLGGGDGTPAARLGLAPGAVPAEVRAAALAELARWQRRAEHPLSSPAVVDAARVAVRTCEGMVAALPLPSA